MSTRNEGEQAAAGYPRPFGPYLLLRPLNRGGMGEVYLAKHGKVDGIEKFCVVKTLRRAFTDDDQYVARFIEEARVVVHLGHRNICHVFDVGKVAERYYLAMELIAGRDLRRVQEAAETASTRVPVELALHIMVQVLEALDYAHRHVHPATGEPLGLVHRDVSPQNVMVNLEGEVKLIDFGLAATNLNVDPSSDSGIVIGKLAYMAPEQLAGAAVDARCDVFSAAVILYELLSGQRFYEGLPKRQIWDAAKDGWRPPRLGELEPELASLLLSALAERPEERLSCDALLEQFERYRLTHGFGAGTRQLRGFMKELFPGEQEAVRDMLRRYAREGGEWPADEAERTTSIARSARPSPLSSLSPEEQTATESIAVSGDASLEESGSETVRHLPAISLPQPPGVGRAFLAGGLAVTLMGGLWLLLAEGSSPLEDVGPMRAPSPAANIERAAVSPAASPESDGAPASPRAQQRASTPPSAPANEPSARAFVAKAPDDVGEVGQRGAADSQGASPSEVEALVPTPSSATPSPPAPSAAASTVTRAPDAARAPPTEAAAPVVVDIDSLTFEEKIERLETDCSDTPCAGALVEEFRGAALSSVATQRLATAVDEVKRCLAACAQD